MKATIQNILAKAVRFTVLAMRHWEIENLIYSSLIVWAYTAYCGLTGWVLRIFLFPSGGLHETFLENVEEKH